MRSEFAAALCLAFFAAAFFAGARATEGGPSVHGRLRVEGTDIVNERGEAIQLRGMSSHGLRWYPEYINYSAILDTKGRGANLFRLAMYADSAEGGYSESPEAARVNRQFVHIGVENALAADMYVIVDWHLLKDKNPLLIADQAEEFFRWITSRYPDNPSIIYEICNEPNGGTTWQEIATYARRIVPVIHEQSPNAIIVVGTPFWSSDLLAVLDDPLSFGNVMYAYHYYSGHVGYHFGEKLDIMRQEGMPVFVTEWGLGGEGKELEEDAARMFVAYMRKHRLSWANWSLANKDEHFSVLRPEVTKLYGWTEDDLTVSGKLVFEALSGK